ncbi:MAG: hypothetical protein P9L92_14325 [Candidatus Electryonea clarkiae]|nr:hypothetical protein [Candidatus Electryonea clarkiae]MDP8287155.1 hypothetical protein [Candidatus Electryonea clarkiae]
MNTINAKSNRFCIFLTIITASILVCATVTWTGCSALGFSIGNNLDEKYALKTMTVLDSIKIDDKVEILLNSGDLLIGKIREIEPGKHVIIRIAYTNRPYYEKWKSETVQWINIAEISHLDKRVRFRAILTAWGVIVDGGCVIFMIIARGMGDAISSAGY